MKAIIFFLMLIFVSPEIWMAQTLGTDQVMKLDVVALISGNEVEGKPEFAIEHDGFRYLFANEANKDKFEKNRSAFEIQMSGGCGRMGSLSGIGSTDRWVVHDNRLYIFASDGCRSGFLKSPDSMLEKDDENRFVDASADNVEKGQHYLNQVLTAMGGTDAIENVRSYSESFTKDVESGSNQYEYTSRLDIDFGSQVAEKLTQYDDMKYVNRLDDRKPDSSYFESPTDKRTMYEAARREFRRQLNRNLLSILKSRMRDDFKVAFVDDRDVDGTELANLSVYFDGSWSLMSIDKKTNLVHSLTYRARGPNQLYSDKTLTLLDYKPVNGINLPHRRVSRFGAKDEGEAQEYQIQLKAHK